MAMPAEPIERLMRLVVRHPAPFLVVLSACATIAAVFALARPVYGPKHVSNTFSQVRRYSPDAVRSAFSGQGIQLRRSKAFEITVLSQSRNPRADELQVLVAPRTSSGSWGPKLESYDKHFGNVAVTYGGRDRQLLARVEAAVSALR
jgi:hypothetical protein